MCPMSDAVQFASHLFCSFAFTSVRNSTETTNVDCFNEFCSYLNKPGDKHIFHLMGLRLRNTEVMAFLMTHVYHPFRVVFRVTAD